MLRNAMKNAKLFFYLFLSAIVLGCGGSDGFSTENTSNSNGSSSTNDTGGQLASIAGIELESHFTIAAPAQRSSLQISGDGTIITFLSDQDITGDNPDAVNQVFSIVGGITTQVTNFDAITNGMLNVTPGYSNSTFAMSQDGSTLAWIGTNDPLGTNADGSTEIFISDIAGNITQLTDNPSSSFIHLDISADGSLIAFTSTDDLVGSNAGNDLQVFTILTAAPNTISQLTNTTAGGNILTFRLSGDGSTVCFSSFNDWLGSNPTTDYQIFTIETNGANFTQQTTAAEAHLSPVISDDASRIAFHSQGDLTGSNPGGTSEIFMLETGTMTITQLTVDRSIHTSNSILGRSFFDISGNGELLVHIEDVGGSLTMKTITLSSPITATTVLQTPQSSTGTSDYIDIPFTNTDGSKTIFVSNFDFRLTDTSETADQIYSFNQ